jgi:hypothetical protein
MTSFYGGQRCIITGGYGGVQWYHILDAALKPSNDRVRQNRHYILLNRSDGIPVSLQICSSAIFVKTDIPTRTFEDCKNHHPIAI